MTHSQKYKLNKVMIKRYMAFLPECETDSARLKLISEIARLHLQNRHIAKMHHEDAQKDTHDYIIEVPSHENQIEINA